MGYNLVLLVEFDDNGKEKLTESRFYTPADKINLIKFLYTVQRILSLTLFSANITEDKVILGMLIILET
jgi:hypothetical protein